MPGSDLNITLPVVGTDSWPVWADRVTSALTTIINDIEAQIVTSEILENADHDFNGFALTDAKWLTFRGGNATNIPTYGVGFKNGDLYACDASGNQIQVTSGGQLAGVGNGFRGDTAYATYTAASSLYEFLDSSNAYDDVKANDFLVANGSTATATIGFGGAVNTSFTLPSTAAAGVSVLTIDAAGQVAHNATIGVGFTVNNADITLTGTADILHPTRERSVILAGPGFDIGGSTWGSVATDTNKAWQVELHEGERVIGMKFRFDPNTTTLLRIYRVVDGVKTALTLSTAATSLSVPSGAVQTQTITLQTPYTYATNETIVASVDTSALGGGGGGATTVYHIALQYDRA